MSTTHTPGRPPSPLTRPDGDRIGPRSRATIALGRIDRRRLWLFLVTGLVAVVATRSITKSRAVVAGLGTLRPVAIAAGDLPPGHLIDDADVRWEQWPVAIAAHYPGEAVIDGATVRSLVAAGEPIAGSRLFDDAAMLDLDERAVTIPMPLAPPPVQIGDQVELIGLRPGISLGDQQLLDTRSLGRARIMNLDETGITVAIGADQVTTIVETIAVGSVEIVLTPFGS